MDYETPQFEIVAFAAELIQLKPSGRDDLWDPERASSSRSVLRSKLMSKPAAQLRGLGVTNGPSFFQLTTYGVPWRLAPPVVPASFK